MSAIIEVENLSKTYPGGIQAVRGISFEVQEGEIFGFLGPNGAGKSTTIMMLTSLIRPTSGTARIAGFDVVRSPYEVRRRLGYVSQDLAVDDTLTGRENLRLQAALYHVPAGEARRRIDELLELVGLRDRADDPVESYSGGMRKRLDIAGGLVHRPRVLFLDEPTLGLDIQTRQEIWRYIRQLREQSGMTLFLTTHYMEEADSLCDRIAIIDRGELRAIDSPAALKSRIRGDVIYLRLTPGQEAPGSDGEHAAALLQALRAIPGVRDVVLQGAAQGEAGGAIAGGATGNGPAMGPAPGLHAAAGGGEGGNGDANGDAVVLAVMAEDGAAVLPRLFEALQAAGRRVASVTMKRPSLDDVYLSFTGRELRQESGSREEAFRARLAVRRARGGW